MAPVAEPRIKFTRADYDLVPEDLRVELIDGELLKMASPNIRHQRIVMRAFIRLLPVVGEERVLFGPVDFVIDDENVLVPDLVVFSEDAVPESDAQGLDRALVVIEILSPSTAARDRTVKAELYLGAGVAELWLIDPRRQTVEIKTATCERAAKGDEAVASEVIAGFTIKASELF